MTDEELIEARRQLTEECGEEIANAVFGFGEDWLEGFTVKKAED